MYATFAGLAVEPSGGAWPRLGTEIFASRVTIKKVSLGAFRNSVGQGIWCSCGSL